MTLDRSDLICIKLENAIKYELATSEFKTTLNIITTYITSITCSKAKRNIKLNC